MQHGLGQPGMAVIGRGVAQVVGLVVHHQVALRRQPQHRVDRARQVSAQRLAAQRSATSAGRRTAPPGHRRAGAPAATHPHRTPTHSGQRRARRRRPTGSRSPIPATDPADRSAAASSRPPAGPTTCHSSAPTLRPDSAAVDIDRPPRQAAVAPGSRVRRRSPRRRDRRSPAPRAPAIRTSHPPATPPSATARPARSILGQRDIVGLVVELGDLRLAGDPGGLGDPDETGVRGAPPAGVDTAVEVAAVQVRRHRLGRHRRRRGDHRLFDDRPARGLPFAKPGHRVVVGDLRGLAPVGHHGVAGSAAAQQPGQTAVGLIEGR